MSKVSGQRRRSLYTPSTADGLIRQPLVFFLNNGHYKNGEPCFYSRNFWNGRTEHRTGLYIVLIIMAYQSDLERAEMKQR
jgi:hypothetical protein